MESLPNRVIGFWFSLSTQLLQPPSQRTRRRSAAKASYAANKLQLRRLALMHVLSCSTSQLRAAAALPLGFLLQLLGWLRKAHRPAMLPTRPTQAIRSVASRNLF